MASRTRAACRRPAEFERHVAAAPEPPRSPPPNRSRVTWVRVEDLPPLDPERRRQVRWVRVDRKLPAPATPAVTGRRLARVLALTGVIAEFVVAVASAIAWRWYGGAELLCLAAASAAIYLWLLRYV